MIQLLANVIRGYCFLFIAALLVLAPLGTAQTGNPPGSYTQSCSSIQVSGSTLSASCQNLQNGQNNTTLNNYTQCVGDIANFAGNLTCSNTAIPAGSYQKSCRFAWAWIDSSNTTTLYANCQTTSGLWNSSQLVGVNQCSSGSDIANLDGTLACTVAPGVHAGVPVGSYTSSCRNIWVFGNSLNAECQTMLGGWVQSQIDVSQCAFPIANFNGTLVCSSKTPPNGSYTQSCTVPLVSGSGSTLALNAACKTAAGNSLPAQLVDYDQCIGDIANYDGVLACNIGGQPPSGSYSQSCRYAWLNGSTLNAECKTSAGAWQPTALSDVSECPGGSITNLDGTLACNVGSPKSGSYTQTCRNLWSLEDVLYAVCKTKSGSWLATSLGQFNQCTGDISNNNGILQCATFSAPNFPASLVVAGVVVDDQEQSNWCWAATGEMVMGYFGTQVRQCDEVKTEKGLSNCCGFPHFAMQYLTDQKMNCQGCNCGGSPPYGSYGHSGTSSATALTWAQLQVQFATDNKPISFAWNWCGGGAHVLVAFGYTTAGGNQVWVMDPESAEPYLVSYDEWSTNPNNNGTCSAGDIYNHAFQGDEYDIL
jgi:hypothetical protein